MAEDGMAEDGKPPAKRPARKAPAKAPREVAEAPLSPPVEVPDGSAAPEAPEPTGRVEIPPAAAEVPEVADVPAAALAPPEPSPVLPPPTPLATPANATPALNPEDHEGYFDAETGERIEDLESVFELIPGMATMVRTRRRVLERHVIPGTRGELTDRLWVHRGVQMPGTRAQAMVATARALASARR